MWIVGSLHLIGSFNSWDALEGILETPKINESVEVDGSPSTLSNVQIYDDETDFPLLVLGEIHGQVCLQ